MFLANNFSIFVFKINISQPCVIDSSLRRRTRENQQNRMNSSIECVYSCISWQSSTGNFGNGNFFSSSVLRRNQREFIFKSENLFFLHRETKSTTFQVYLALLFKYTQHYYYCKTIDWQTFNYYFLRTNTFEQFIIMQKKIECKLKNYYEDIQNFTKKSLMLQLNISNNPEMLASLGKTGLLLIVTTLNIIK